MTFKKLIKGILLTLTLIISIIFSIYSLAWYSFTKRAEAYLNVIWQDKSHFTVTGDIPRFSGYPFIPKAKFSGTFKHISGIDITTPELIMTGFPAPFQTQMLEAPQGIQITSNYLERPIKLDYGYIQFKIPHLPASDTREDINTWQKTKQPITVEHFVIQTGSIYARGSGTIGLDDNLQLNADITTRVIGLETLLDSLAAEQGERSIAIVRNLFNMMSQIDDKTGEKYFETSLKIQNRAIYFGPMRVSGIPELKWK
ncbi:MAG: DUF2125 domain-containing protein [Alphaproteobacteria bacterium]|nr:DUF2125 domain-containing protein [Alphaproteobacteria bacterium]